VLLTIGRHGLASFTGLEPVEFLVRTVEDPEPVPFEPSAIVRGRGPFSVEDEAALLAEHGIELLVTKNAGGDEAKLVAARAARIPVVIVRRTVAVDVDCFTNAADALAWLESLAP
jgi:precorrin-6A/cobalt-precorrin-6A reductase